MTRVFNFMASWAQIVVSGILLITFTWLKLYDVAYPETLLLLSLVFNTGGIILRFLNFGKSGSNEAMRRQ